MTGTRHWFVLEPLTLPRPLDTHLAEAANLERAGNWYLAGEAYAALKNVVNASAAPILKAKLLAKAAACFEIAGDSRISARFYEEAAQEIVALNLNAHLAAELYNRAALQFRESREFFFAGSAWTRAAEEFGKIEGDIINLSENLSPLPMSSLKSHLCGVCFEAAAAAYAQAEGNAMWSVGAYWRAGKAYAEGIPNIQAFEAYRRSLVANIRYYGTLELEKLRSSLPLSQKERATKVNPIEIMEAALVRCNNHHQSTPGDTPQSRLQTNRQMAATFHEFTLALQAAGNIKEVGQSRSSEHERQRKIYLLEKSYLAAAIYTLWRMTSNYGESIGRWATTCLLVILGFALAFDIAQVVGSSGSTSDKSLRFFDYVYFSVITFSTLGYGDLHPVGLLGQALACLEVAAGFIMFGVLLSFVGNRFQRG